MHPDQPQFPIVFLAGPPGVGKTTFGRAACEQLGLRFLDLADAGDVGRQESALDRLSADRTADVVELPWELQLERGTFKKCRVLGETVALWAHPLDMQQRSGRSQPLFTPGRSTTRGGFGLRGTGCPEFRRINRACETTLLLVGMSFDEAREEVQDVLARLTLTPSGTPAEQEGMADWATRWQQEYQADAEATEVLVDAMARFIQHLKKQGKSPRSLSGVYSDLSALGMLNFGYDYDDLTGETVLRSLTACQYEFNRKFSCSEKESRRYERTYQQFCKFLAAEKATAS